LSLVSVRSSFGIVTLLVGKQQLSIGQPEVSMVGTEISNQMLLMSVKTVENFFVIFILYISTVS